MKRGDIVTVAQSGDLGKPRPALIVETDLLAATQHVIICPGTSHIRDDVEQRRLLVAPTENTGLKLATQFQVDKITVTRRDRCGPVIGRLDAEAISTLNGLLFVVMGLAD